jgi:hypothetical protein
MRILTLIMIFTGLGLTCFSQRTLVLQKLGSPSRYIYDAGDHINLKTAEKKLRLKGTVLWIGDTSFSVGKHYTVDIEDIARVNRVMHFPKLMSNLFLIAGGGYIVLDAFNNLINNQQVFDQQTLIIGGSLIAAGLILIPVYHRHIHVGLKWKMKIIYGPVPRY